MITTRQLIERQQSEAIDQQLLINRRCRQKCDKLNTRRFNFEVVLRAQPLRDLLHLPEMAPIFMAPHEDAVARHPDAGSGETETFTRGFLNSATIMASNSRLRF